MPGNPWTPKYIRELLDGVNISVDGTKAANSDLKLPTEKAIRTYVASAISTKANLASPTFTGTPAAPTAAGGTNTTQIATTAFVTSAVSAKANSASPTLTGTPAAPTAAPGTNTTQIATTAFVAAAAALLAPLASPALTGVPTAPTAVAGTNTTQVATTAFVSTAVANLVAAAPAALDTLNELAAALGNDPNFATTISTQIGLKAPIASPTFTGTPAAPTAAPGTSTTQISTTAFVGSALTAFTGSANVVTVGTITTGVWSGTAIGVAKGGTGLTGTPSNGQLAIGNGAGYTLATLTGTANQVTVTNGAGTITLALPQDLHTTATPSFTAVTAGTLAKLNAYDASSGQVCTTTVDGTDNARLFLSGGGAAGVSRGGYVALYGNEYVSIPGFVAIHAGSATSAAITLNINGTEAARISPSRYLLVGTTSEDGSHSLVVNGAASIAGNIKVGGAAPCVYNAVAANRLLLTGSTNAAVAGGGGTIALRASDSATNAGGLELYSGNSERMRLLSSGNFLIATTTDNATDKLQVNGSFSAGTTVPARIVSVGADSVAITTTTADTADNCRLQLAGGGATGTTRGAYINVHGNEHASAPGWVSLHAGNTVDSVITFATGGTEGMRVTQARRFLIGTTTENTTTGDAKLQLSNGAYLGNSANSAANVLDWYEEGTFTPVAVGSSTAGAGTYTSQNGYYTRIGRVVHFTMALAWSAHTGTGNLLVNGLPFTSNSASNNVAALSTYYSGLTTSAGKELGAIVAASSTQIALRIMDPLGGAVADLGIDAAVTYLTISGSYIV